MKLSLNFAIIIVITLSLGICFVMGSGVLGSSEPSASDSNDYTWVDCNNKFIIADSNYSLIFDVDIYEEKRRLFDHNDCTDLAFYSKTGNCEISCKDSILHVIGDVNALVNMFYDYINSKFGDIHTNPVVFEKENE